MANFALLAAAAEHAAEEPTALWLSPGGWVAASMLFVFLLMVYLKVPALVGRMLDSQIDVIRSQLADAAKLRAEAEALKIEFETKLRHAAKQAEVMKADAETEATAIITKAKDDSSALIARRQQSAEDKIAAAERSAIADLRAKAADAATSAARQLIADGHSAAADKSLVDAAIAGI